MSPESSTTPSGNTGINWDSRGPALTENRVLKKHIEDLPDLMLAED